MLVLFRDHGAAAAAYLRGLSDEELDRTTTPPVFGPDPVTVQHVIEMVLIGPPLVHGNGLRQGLGHAGHEHPMQEASA